MRTIISLFSLCLLVGAMVPAQDDLSLLNRKPNSQNTVITERFLLNSESNLLRIPESQSGVLVITSYGQQMAHLTLRVPTITETNSQQVSWKPLREIDASLHNSPVVTQPVSKTRPTNLSKIAPTNIEHKAFFLHTSSGSLTSAHSYSLVTSDLLAEGDRVRVYLDSTCSDPADFRKVADKIITCLDQKIMPLAEKSVGSFADVDRDGKLSVLLSPRLQKMQCGASSVKGFVRSSDFREGIPRPFSNHSDVIYINSECPPDTNFHTLLAHEYWHVLQFSYRLVQSDPPLEIQDDWICEGSAHLAEHTLGGDGDNLAHRLQTWIDAPESSPLIVPNYYEAGLWRHDGCRGGLYLFFRWCEMTYGPDFLTVILQSDQTDIDCVEKITGTSMDHLMAHALVSIVSVHRAQSADDSEKKLIRENLFPDVTLSNLRMHDLSRTSPVDVEIAPTASTFVKIQGGERVHLTTDRATQVRAIFIPDAQVTNLAENSGRKTKFERSQKIR